MASRFFTTLNQLRARASGPIPKPGGAEGTPGDETKGGAFQETPRTWPTAGPAGSTSFNRATRWPVVKTRASKQGVD